MGGPLPHSQGFSARVLARTFQQVHQLLSFISQQWGYSFITAECSGNRLLEQLSGPGNIRGWQWTDNIVGRDPSSV